MKKNKGRSLIHIWWFTLSWWKYLLEKPLGDNLSERWIRFWCRARGHPNGIVYFNPNGYEPDTTCVDCGDDIG